MTRDLIFRIEPRTRTSSLEPGLEARLFDPAWTLGRQWVLGELEGEDSGNPVLARSRLAQHVFGPLRIGGTTVDLDPQRDLLDALVEAVPREGSWSLVERVDSGRALADALKQAGLRDEASVLLSEFPLVKPVRLAEDVGAQALWALARGRVPDGQAIAEWMQNDPSRFGWGGAAKDILQAWLEGLPHQVTTSAWDPARFEYDFSVDMPSLSDSMTAKGYDGRGLDWHSFAREGSVGGATPTSTLQIERVPTAVTFAGMPEPRYWMAEGRQVDFGAVDAEATDLARMAMLQFAFVYGNDAFILPFATEVGSLMEVMALEVVDTFGHVTSILPAARRGTSTREGFAFLSVDPGNGPRTPALVVPCVGQSHLTGTALEEVLLMRDEMANLVWAMERSSEGDLGKAVVRPEAIARSAPAAPTRGEGPADHYRLRSDVPENWFPMALQPGPPRMLRLERLGTAAGPAGQILPQPGEGVHENEVPREGLALGRRVVLARGPDGRYAAWCRNERGVGRGEGSSGLAFDRLAQGSKKDREQ
jgi:hypothetical protein